MAARHDDTKRTYYIDRPAANGLDVTSVRVERRGVHELVSVWIRGQQVGTLIVSPGEGIKLVAMLGGNVVSRRVPR